MNIMLKLIYPFQKKLKMKPIAGYWVMLVDWSIQLWFNSLQGQSL